MSIGKELSKIILKLFDRNIYTSFFPKLINRNSSKMNKNNYKLSNDYSYIFVHIPKTGGMSLNSVVDEINQKNQSNKIFRGGHNPISLFHSMDDKKYFTVIRNPIVRAYSFYRMSLKDRKQPYNYLAKKSFYHFVTYCPEVQNIYCKYFSGEIEKDVNSDIYQIAENNIKKFYYIVNFSNFEHDTKKLFDKIGYKNMKLPHINSSESSDISIDEKKILEFYNSYDLKLYSFLKSNNYLE